MNDSTNPLALNVLGVKDLVENQTNKVPGGSGESPEGPKGERYDALAVKVTDEELLDLRDRFEKEYAPYEARLKERVRKNKDSYVGKYPKGQFLIDDDLPIAANLQFEAEETFLAAALAKNPEPVVYCDNTEEGNVIANSVRTMLQFHADTLCLRRKFAVLVRQWSINTLGVLKPGWDSRISDVAIDNRKVSEYVFDPKGFVDAYGDFTSWYGERITVTAERLAEIFPEHKTYIQLTVGGKMGTDVVYTEWWPNDEYCFLTYKEKVLDKFRNPFFNYPEPIVDELGRPVVDPITNEQQVNKVFNHFAHPKKPGVFLSVYSLQEQPHDITSNLEQNIPNQNLITKRTLQIDQNISSSNNGYAYSEANFNQETAKQAANARSIGNPILIPQGGPIERAIMPLPAQGLPSDAFVELENNKANLRTSWGVQGITAQPQDEDQTARGMILNQAHDSSRIGGGIGSAVEQVADNVFNWLVQLYTVYYDEPHFAAVMGSAKAVEYIALSRKDFKDRQLIVSVSPDSMRPRDEITNMNLSQALYDKGAIGPKTLLKMLDFPDPDKSAEDGVLWQVDKMAYIQLNFPELFAQVQGIQAQMAQQQMLQQAQSTALNTQAESSATPPEATSEPEKQIAQDPASAALSQVPIAV